MTTVVFKTDYNDGENHHKRGELVQLDDAQARVLVDMGVVEIRRAHEPTETKSDEPEPEET